MQDYELLNTETDEVIEVASMDEDTARSANEAYAKEHSPNRWSLIQ